MSLTTNQASIALRPGLKSMFGLYHSYPEEWKEFYKSYTSDKYQEIDVEMRYSGYAGIKPEGQSIALDSGMGQRVITNYIHKTVGLSFDITREMIRDNLYPTLFPKESMSLRTSLRATKNVLATNVLNTAFSTNNVIGDGQPLCSPNHPIDGGICSNAFSGQVSADLSEASLEQAIIAIGSFKMQSGILAMVLPEKLIVAMGNQFAASRIVNSQFRPDSTNNAINAINHGNYIPKGFVVNHHLSSQSAWFLLTDAEEGFKHFQRENIQVDSSVDPKTHNITFQAYERYSFGNSNFRSVFGSQGV